MTVRKIVALLLVFCPCILHPLLASAKEEDFGEKALATIKIIASADYQGRKTGTPGGLKTEHYLAEKFKECGLRPWNGSYLQKFTFLSYNLLPGCALELVKEGRPSLPFTYNEDFYFLAGSANSELRAEVVFVGYGIHAPEKGYDDYNGIDVKNKIVLAMQGLPPGDPGKYGEKASWTNTKAKIAQEQGAKALLLFNDPSLLSYFPPYKVWGIDKDELLHAFVVAEINFMLLDKILEGTREFAVDLKRRIDESGKPASFGTGKTIHLKCRASIDEKCEGANVLGFIPGTDPVLKNELVSIGGHLDGGGVDPDGAIFYGAEDNASGASVVLEIAERLVKKNYKPLRTIMFAAWGAEEQGAYGSQYYVDNPVFPLDKNAFNFCVDNVGWGEGEFWLFSANNFPEEFEVAKAGVDRDLLKHFIPKGQGGSDSYFFQGKGIPVLFAHTTQAQMYNHRPLDRAELINPLALRNVTKFMYQAMKAVASYKGTLINPDRYPLFIHRYSAVADSQEDLMNPGSQSPEKDIEKAKAKYQILRLNGIDLCGQNIPSPNFKETALNIKSFLDSIKKVNGSIDVLEKASQLREIEEGVNFLVALRISGLRSFDSDLVCLEVLHGLGAQILSLDLSSTQSPDFRAIFNERSELSPFGSLLLKKSEELGLVLEFLEPGPEILDRILAVKSKPVLVTSPRLNIPLIQKVAPSPLREKLYFSVPIDAGSDNFSQEIDKKLKTFLDLNDTKFCILDPFSYSSTGKLKNFTIGLFREKYPEGTVKDILGDNFIRLFSVNLQN
jgi:microsomal dipeptidase-like Zn-dependent dipeptidase